MAGDPNDPTLARIEQLEARIAELEARDDTTPSADSEARPVSRRRLLGMAGAAAAGAVGATVAAAAPAGAIDPNDITIDMTNNGVSTTGLTSSLASGSTFYGVNTGGQNGIGLHGDAQGGGAGRGVLGSAASGTGVNGTATTGFGVQGGAGAGIGVAATSSTGPSLRVAAPTANTNGRHMELVPGSTVGPPTGGTHAIGEFWMDNAGVLFQCVVAGSPGTWARQAPLVTLPAPVRVFDSRAGQPNGGGSTQGALTFTAAPPAAAFRDVNVSQNAVGGAVVVPPGASAVLMNLAVVSISGVGALAVCRHGATQPGTANINWFAGGQVLSNAVTSAVDVNRHVDVVIVSGGGASTQFILDVVGYYL